MRPFRARYPSILADRGPGGGRVVPARDSCRVAEGQRDRSDVVVLVLFWTLPLLAAAGLLLAAGLPQAALALVAVEVLVGVAVAVAARRPDERPDERPPRPARPWVVPAAMVGVLVGLVGVTLLAVRLG